MLSFKSQIAILMVLLGCCLNVIFLELLVKKDPGIGNLITFLSFSFISLEGFIFTTKCGTLGPKVPFRAWTILVIMYFIVSVTNNCALNFDISMPLHMIFRAGSLIANMIMGMIILGRRYSVSKYASILMISIGITICTIMSGVDQKNEQEAHDWNFLTWIIGISMLTIALFLSARMGLYQEAIYSTYGKYPQEALFYSHVLPLPAFIFLAPNLIEHFYIALTGDPVTFGSYSIPSPLLYLGGNMVTQYICIRFVFVLTSECNSLTVTLVVTLRKFLSLLFSIWYFQNPFTIFHWIGATLVFAGTLLFSEIPHLLYTKLIFKDKVQ